MKQASPVRFFVIFLVSLFSLGIVQEGVSQPGKNKKSSSEKNKKSENDEEEDADPEDGKLPEGFTQDDKIHYLELQCTVSEPVKGNGKTSEESVPFVLFRVDDENGRLKQPLITSEKGKCKFRLGFNHEYKIIISRKGYVQKTIKANTHLPKDLNTAYIFPADISFYRETEGVDASIFKEPVAIIAYSEKTKQFEYDIAFMKKMQPEIKKFTAAYLKKAKPAK